MPLPRYSLRMLVIVLTTSACLFAWVLYPKRAAERLVRAIQAKDPSQVERLVQDSSVHRLVSRGRYDVEDVQLHCDERTFLDIASGRQTFLTSGYGGTHRFIVVRGNITTIWQTWFFGGFEMVR